MTTYPKRSPLKAIRVFCVECQGDSFQGVSECADTACPFREYRSGKALEAGQHRPLGAVRRYCHEYCQAGAGRAEVLSCQGDKPLDGGPGCPVFPFRLGKNPNISEETRKKARQRELAKLVEGANSLPLFPAHGLFDAPESTQTGPAIL
jgi:hypothetical protein